MTGGYLSKRVSTYLYFLTVLFHFMILVVISYSKLSKNLLPKSHSEITWPQEFAHGIETIIYWPCPDLTVATIWLVLLCIEYLGERK